MQGGIRRKNDLLPRYRAQSGGNGKNSFLTTPMKKAIIYLIMLAAVFFAVQTLVAESKAPQVSYELEDSGKNTDLAGKTNEKGGLLDAAQKLASSEAQNAQNKPQSGVKVPKEKFNNEVAMQQEVKNLEEHEQEYQKSKNPASKDSKQGVGSDVKADKQQPGYLNEAPVDEQAKKINDKAPYKKTDASKQVDNSKSGKKVVNKAAATADETK
ncbi:LAME_0H12508g1_1 [Lachancea meyersii CBS 8951]|uniref:LAME_0H12508g1_1 n=1 Tax=Lachancea meyersii CBS 8951 TaxID=1266667 RepID=A0A1G4KGQ3_9SACH|nr:LAME_0H12508g1_1 [Lachancea meyersii CBS 8951]